jgi:protoheme IX farnesyltransferase
MRGAIIFGLGLSIPGLALAWWLDPLFGVLVSLGFVFDLGVYTIWLKRRTPFSIFLGGISGGMPALAGRALALGRIDIVGLLLASGVLLWIPSHTLTLTVRYAKDYELSSVPVWPNVYGPRATMRLVAVATLGGAVVLGIAGYLIDINLLALVILLAMGLGLSALALVVLFSPTEGLNWLLFKTASLYMLGAFICLTIGSIL